MAERTRGDVVENIVLAESPTAAHDDEGQAALFYYPVNRAFGYGEVGGDLLFCEEGGHWNNCSNGMPVCAETRNAVLILKDFLP